MSAWGSASEILDRVHRVPTRVQKQRESRSHAAAGMRMTNANPLRDERGPPEEASAPSGPTPPHLGILQGKQLLLFIMDLQGKRLLLWG